MLLLKPQLLLSRVKAFDQLYDKDENILKTFYASEAYSVVKTANT
jgi:hypothetical protein